MSAHPPVLHDEHTTNDDFLVLARWVMVLLGSVAIIAGGWVFVTIPSGEHDARRLVAAGLSILLGFYLLGDVSREK